MVCKQLHCWYYISQLIVSLIYWALLNGNGSLNNIDAKVEMNVYFRLIVCAMLVAVMLTPLRRESWRHLQLSEVICTGYLSDTNISAQCCAICIGYLCRSGWSTRLPSSFVVRHHGACVNCVNRCALFLVGTSSNPPFHESFVKYNSDRQQNLRCERPGHVVQFARGSDKTGTFYCYVCETIECIIHL